MARFGASGVPQARFSGHPVGSVGPARGRLQWARRTTRRDRPRIPGPAHRAVEGDHAHRPRFSPARRRPGACAARARARRGGGRQPLGRPVRAPARARRALGSGPASLSARRLGRGGRRPHGPRARGVARVRRRGSLPRATRPSLGGHRPRRRRDRCALPLDRAPRRRGALRDRLLRPCAAAARPARGQRLLRVEHVRGGRRGPLRGGAGAARGDGLQRCRRGRRPRDLSRARRLRRRLPRPGHEPRPHGVLR